ncbi:MAG: tetratricopeptide repeat protein, partial [Gammaproteobacteria bacterium]|nr:tetratricopeptide repeat protein [Gammaproteobacteria bacterium]
MKLPAGLILVLSLSVQPVLANWFENSEQTGKRLFETGEFRQSADAFKDKYRRGVALYMAGEYKAAESEFEKVKREEVRQDARYNLGNARFRQDNFEGAIRAYDEVLAEEPGHSEARHNQGLAKAMLAKTDPEALARLEKEKKEEQQKKEKQEEQEKQEQESQS